MLADLWAVVPRYDRARPVHGLVVELLGYARAVPGVAHAGITVWDRRRAVVWTEATDEVARALSAVQAVTGGPGRDAADTGAPIRTGARDGDHPAVAPLPRRGGRARGARPCSPSRCATGVHSGRSTSTPAGPRGSTTAPAPSWICSGATPTSPCGCATDARHVAPRQLRGRPRRRRPRSSPRSAPGRSPRRGRASPARRPAPRSSPSPGTARPAGPPRAPPRRSSAAPPASSDPAGVEGDRPPGVRRRDRGAAGGRGLGELLERLHRHVPVPRPEEAVPDDALPGLDVDVVDVDDRRLALRRRRAARPRRIVTSAELPAMRHRWRRARTERSVTLRRSGPVPAATSPTGHGRVGPTARGRSTA